jgi:hypothetical protein
MEKAKISYNMEWNISVKKLCIQILENDCKKTNVKWELNGANI